MILAGRFGEDVRTLVSVPEGVLSTNAAGPHRLQYGLEAAFHRNWSVRVDVEQEYRSVPFGGSHKRRIDGERLVDVSKRRGGGSVCDPVHDVATPNGTFRVADVEGEVKIMEDLEWIRPRFDPATFDPQDRKLVAHLVEVRVGLRDPTECNRRRGPRYGYRLCLGPAVSGHAGQENCTEQE